MTNTTDQTKTGALRSVEAGDGLPKARITDTRYGLEMSITHNGYHWTALNIDDGGLAVIEDAIALYHALYKI